MIEERILGIEDTIDDIDTTVKENQSVKNFLTPNIQEIQDTMKRPNLRIIGIEERKDSQCKGPGNIFNNNKTKQKNRKMGESAENSNTGM